MCFGKGANLLCNEDLSCLQEESGARGARDPSGSLQNTPSSLQPAACIHVTMQSTSAGEHVLGLTGESTIMWPFEMSVTLNQHQKTKYCWSVRLYLGTL